MSKSAIAVVPAAQPQSTVAAALGIPPNASADELLDIGVQAFNASGLWMARAGAAFKALKADCERSQSSFKEVIEARGIVERRAYEAIGYAEFLERLPEAEARRLLAVPHTKVMALAKADPEMVAELLEEGALDGDAPLSIRQLRARLKEAEVKAAKLDTELDRTKRLHERLARANSALESESELPRFARSVRHEAFAFEDGAGWMLDNLEAICSDDLFRDVQHPEAHRWQPVAATNAHAALNKIRGRITRLIQQIERAYPASPDETISLDHQLSPLELQSLNERCDRMRFTQTKEAEGRAARRANTQAGRKGRRRAEGES